MLRPFPSTQALKRKWWHRLIEVIVIALTITVFLISIFGILDATKEKTVFYFQDGYSSIDQEEISINSNTSVNRIYDLTKALSGKGYDPEWITYNCLKTVVSNILDPTFTNIRAVISNNEIGKNDCNLAPVTYKYWRGWDPLSLFWLLLAPITYLILSLIDRIFLYVIYGKELPK